MKKNIVAGSEHERSELIHDPDTDEMETRMKKRVTNYDFPKKVWLFK